ncbi:MAG TPA: hypothetical protein VE262_15980 [Blastocatellia bacterium]|nr:hypothetical protein [Blastocatellia bacterium]
MDHDLKQIINQFSKNLKWQIEDLELEKQGFTIDLFFDSVDVEFSVLGMQGVYDPKKDALERIFFEPRTLVNCLAAAGWLGPIHLLPPHQAEFLTGLNLDFGIGKTRNDPEFFAKMFLRAVRRLQDPEEEAVSVDELTPNELLEFVREHAGSAVNTFKAIQCIRGGTWEARLANMKKRQLLELSTPSADFNSIINSTTFDKIRGIFNKRRKNKTPSNFADSVATCILILLIKAIKDNGSKRVPRFFDSAELFREVAKESGLKQSFTFPVSAEITGTVIRDAEYFIYKSIFRPDQNSSFQGKKGSVPSFDLYELNSQLDQILKSGFDVNTLKDVKLAGTPLTTVIEELSTFSFFENVWLPFSAKIEAQDALQELGKTSRQLKKEAFRIGVEQAIIATQEALAENVREYQRASSVWTQLERVAKTIKQIKKSERSHLDYFRDFRLLRFGFPRTINARMYQVFDALLSQDEEAEKHARTFIISVFYERNIDPCKDYEDIMVITAVLWVAKLDEQIITLLDGFPSIPHFSLKMVYAAAAFRSKQRTDRGLEFLRDLEEEYKAKAGNKESPDLAVGIGYLYFHLLLYQGYDAPWRNSGDIEELSEEQKLWIEKSILYAKAAYSLLKERHRSIKKVYALNQCLYYLVEGAGDNRMDEIDDTAKELVSYRSNKELWQHTFNDTLARYLHRKATQAPNEAEWRRLLEQALRNSELATKGTYTDEFVEGYISVLEVEMAAGFGREDEALKT